MLYSYLKNPFLILFEKTSRIIIGALVIFSVILTGENTDVY